MEKIKVKIKINDYIIEKVGIIDKEIIKVKDKEDIIIFDTKNLILKKENNELKIELNFKEKRLVYTLISNNQKFSTFFTINTLTNSNKQVMINYQIEGADFLLKINYETI